MMSRNLGIPLLLVLVGIGLSGCYEDDRYRYLAHSDTVTLGAGNANAVNAATMTVDPWPPESRNAQIDQDGKRAAIAVKRYETNTSIKPQGLTTTDKAYGTDGGNGDGGAVNQ
jgi:hypothetical protein